MKKVTFVLTLAVICSMAKRYLPHTIFLCIATLAWGGSSLSTAPPAVASDSDITETDLPPEPTLQPSPVIRATLASARNHFEAGDLERALPAAQSVRVHSTRRAERAEAWMLSGWIHRMTGEPDLASAAFTQVRISGSPLSAWASYYEAEQDLLRGRPYVAKRECEAYRSTFPDGPYAGACLRIIALGHASLGNSVAALSVAREWDRLHPKAPIAESIALKSALVQLPNEPQPSVEKLRSLVAKHTLPLVGHVAESTLLDLHQSGSLDTAYPQHNAFLQQRAGSLLTSYRGQEAWSAFQTLASRSEDDPRLKAWAEASFESFAWSSHRWGLVADSARERDATGKDRDLTWKRYRALWRAGRWEEAAQQAREGRAQFGTSRPWKNREETLGHTFLLAGHPKDALPLFESVIAKGGATGRRARFYAGLSAYLDAQPLKAKAHFDTLVDRNSSYKEESLYWRAKLALQMNDPASALADQGRIIEEDPHSWYATLIAQRDPSRSNIRPYSRDGQWPTPDVHENQWNIDFPWPSRFENQTTTSLHPIQILQPHVEGVALDDWPYTLGWIDNPAVLPTHSIIERVDETLPPPSNPTGTWFSRRDALKIFDRLIAEHGGAWPELHGIRALTQSGLYELSGPAFSNFYETRKKATRRSSHARHQAALAIQLAQSEWRALSLLTRDHHHTARLMHPLVQALESVTSVEERELMRLAYPLAHDLHVWTASHQHGIDPFLILSLMRQESLYDVTAVSHAGAHGPMQILPRTAHLMALEFGDTEFMSPDLEDPASAIPYGVAYLGLLMERYQGSYPLALASYNGGPFNVAAWHAARGGDTPMDLWVELIPYRETRGYVKKVSRNYAIYIDLYGPKGASVQLPIVPRSQDPTVVDF